MKGYHSVITRWKKCIGKMCGKGRGASHSPQISMCSRLQGSVITPSRYIQTVLHWKQETLKKGLLNFFPPSLQITTLPLITHPSSCPKWVSPSNLRSQAAAAASEKKNLRPHANPLSQNLHLNEIIRIWETQLKRVSTPQPSLPLQVPGFIRFPCVFSYLQTHSLLGSLNSM